jgi:hypothetical protein
VGCGGKGHGNEETNKGRSLIEWYENKKHSQKDHKQTSKKSFRQKGGKHPKLRLSRRANHGGGGRGGGEQQSAHDLLIICIARSS